MTDNVGLMPMYEEADPGLWCPTHRSVYCQHVWEALDDRLDVEPLAELIKSRIENWDGGGDQSFKILWISVPVFPAFCVWEKLKYICKDVPPFGPMAELTEPTESGMIIQRIMPGESAADLGSTIRQEFEDELEDYLTKVRSRNWTDQAKVPWRCRSSQHSFRYNQLTEAIASRKALDQEVVTELQQAMIYCLVRHKMCLFCKVNQNNRDAVRVNPSMAQYFPDGENSTTDSDFDDLVPN